jgi:hypothetical protein
VTLAEYLATMNTDEPFMFHQKADICARSSFRQAEEDAERTANDENIEEATEASIEPTSKAADQPQQTGAMGGGENESITGNTEKETPSLGDSGSDSGAEEAMRDDRASQTTVSGDDASGDSGRNVVGNTTSERSKEVVSEPGRNDKAFTDQTASEGEGSEGEESEDSESDESGGPVSTRGRGVRGSKMRGRGGHVNISQTTRSTRSTVVKSARSTRSAANSSVGTSTRGTKRKAEDNQEKPARYVPCLLNLY